MAIYDLYGSLADDINAARESLSASLAVDLEAHESSYQGDYFQWGKTAGEHFVLKRNVDPYDGDPVERSFSEYKILFYVNDTFRSANLHEKIKEAQKFFLLRHEDL